MNKNDRNDMKDLVTYFITWTTYGTWLPGDVRGWRKMKQGNQIPQPRLEEWCWERMKGDMVILSPKHRAKVEAVCREHAEVRCWKLHAINVRSNHVHIAVTSDKPPKITRDQFKANGTRVLREDPDAITDEKSGRGVGILKSLTVNTIWNASSSTY